MRILPVHHYWPTLKGLIRNQCAREAVYPFYASFKLTSRCHFGCPFCNVKKTPTPDLSTNEIKAILDNLSRSPVLMTSFEGGEPLLRDDIEELLKYARKCSFYLLFTTSVKNLLMYPLETYSEYIDFLHISIDEGHNNLELFDILPTLEKLPSQVSVQTVVTRQTVHLLEDKVQACFKSDANIVVIPAAAMDNAKDCFPDMNAFENEVEFLRKRYPDTIHTPSGFFNAYRNHRCSSASVIIAPDGVMYYPCHILGTRGPDLRTTDLTKWLTTQDAKEGRKRMDECKRNCGWYQYYSIDSYTGFTSAWQALRPILIKKKKRKKPVSIMRPLSS